MHTNTHTKRFPHQSSTQLFKLTWTDGPLAALAYSSINPVDKPSPPSRPSDHEQAPQNPNRAYLTSLTHSESRTAFKYVKHRLRIKRILVMRVSYETSKISGHQSNRRPRAQLINRSTKVKSPLIPGPFTLRSWKSHQPHRQTLTAQIVHQAAFPCPNLAQPYYHGRPPHHIHTQSTHTPSSSLSCFRRAMCLVD